jgi:hypothetical protein
MFVIREDERDLTWEYLRSLCSFCKRQLQPMCEAAMIAEDVHRAKKDVLAFMTSENLRIFRDELDSGGADSD